ncbi:MAG: transketolase, partial [Coprobacillus sp.]|nr:transketolase [Coprobacillus sp.]
MSVNYDKLSVATLRSLVLDMTNSANSGHPGMALGSAPILHALFTRELVSDPTHPDWINRDRFILSAGHLSSLLYSISHVAGYNISLDDLKEFRQCGSKTPGHPELVLCHDYTDCTSGPLGQGIGQAVGEAIAETMLSADYKDGKKLINHYTYCLCGDGCLEEGISQEAINLAGLNKLNKLILLYDKNDVTLDGPLSLSSDENTKKRFKAAGWNVYTVRNANKVKKVAAKIAKAKESRKKPSLIICHSVIGYGTNVAGTSKAHGSPVGKEEGKRTKVESYKFDHEDFYVPQEVYDFYNENFIKKGQKAYEKWNKKFEKYAKKHKGDAERFKELEHNDVSGYLPDVFPDIETGTMMSTRVASGKALNDYQLSIPNLVGGSADVAASTETKLEFGWDYNPKHRDGHNLNFGIREFG